MKKKRIETWEKLRAIGKTRYIILIGGFWSAFAMILGQLLELWPDGRFITFEKFGFRIIIHAIGGIFFGFLAWVFNESYYKEVKSKETKGVNNNQ